MKCFKVEEVKGVAQVMPGLEPPFRGQGGVGVFRHGWIDGHRLEVVYFLGMDCGVGRLDWEGDG